MARSSSWLGYQILTLKMTGSSPVRVTSLRSSMEGLYVQNTVTSLRRFPFDSGRGSHQHNKSCVILGASVVWLKYRSSRLSNTRN